MLPDRSNAQVTPRPDSLGCDHILGLARAALAEAMDRLSACRGLLDEPEAGSGATCTCDSRAMSFE